MPRVVKRTRVGPAASPPRRWWLPPAAVALAVGAWLAPLPPGAVDRLYSRGLYSAFQPLVTSGSGLVPFALLDLLLGAAILWLCARVVGIARRPAANRRRASVALAADLTTLAAAAYLVFLGMWGLNYRRPPITAALDFDRRRVTSPAVEAFAERAVHEINALHRSAHADPSALATWSAVRVNLAPAFARAERDLGMKRLAAAGRPKVSLLSPFFRWASVDGMVNPFGLEVIVNPDVLPVERPFVVTHEWGHLAGWARESEASYLAWIACLEGDPAARYSGWLSLYLHLRGAVSRKRLGGLDRALEGGPRADLAAIRARLSRAQPVVQRASWRAYDQFLKANRVPEGVASYDEVVTLVLGTATNPDGRPRLARRGSAALAPAGPTRVQRDSDD